jgi:hypothetical protein
VNPGTGREELAAALGADPDEVWEAISDLIHYTEPVPVRGEWTDETWPRRERYYLTGR